MENVFINYAGKHGYLYEKKSLEPYLTPYTYLMIGDNPKCKSEYSKVPRRRYKEISLCP